MKGLSSTRPAAASIKNRVPIKLLDEQVKEPGWVEADTVAHCGTSLGGVFINSLTVTDLYSAWTVNEAIWGKDAEKVV